MKILTPVFLTISLPLLLAACGTAVDLAEPTQDQSSNLMVDRVRAPIALTLDAPTAGTFSKSKRVYGYTFEVKAGAQMQVTLETRAGAGSSAAVGAKLDTILEVYGPMRDGIALTAADKMVAADDGAGGSVEAAVPSFTAREDGKYLIVFSSWDDTGDASTFTLKAACTGTEFQCKKPLPVGACEAGTKYIRATDVIGTETWKACEVVLLETITVPAGAIITVLPGVTVKGNYLGTSAFGNVSLIVNGQLQAVGTSDRPVTFTSLGRGWKGLVLNSPSNTLENAFVEKAEVGVTFTASSNTVKSTSINSCGAGVVMKASSVGNSLSRVRVTKNDSGIDLEVGAAATIEDAVISGNGIDRGFGLRSASQAPTWLRRSIVSGFKQGISLSSSALEVNHSTIAGNSTGVYMTGASSGRFKTSCPALSDVVRPPPPPPSSWPSRDPLFFDSDIIKNAVNGIHVDAPELLVVERCNITENGLGILNDAVSLHPSSRIVKSNVFGNGTSGLQMESFHINGTLDVSDNYWARLSDPELSASWRMQHSLGSSCSATMTRCEGPGFSSGIYFCTQNTYLNYAGCSRYDFACTGTASTAQNGTFTFTGFSPVMVPAGPKTDTLTDDVKAARAAIP